MAQIYLLLLLLLSSHFSLLPAALPVMPEPDPVPVQPLTTATSTIPAFPEQSDVASSVATLSCPLSLPAALPSSLTSSCSPARSFARCCPPLAAFLYSAFAPTALSLPAGRAMSLPDLPALPDDTEACAGEVERALRSRGADLPRVNSTCDVAYCYCGIRLRRLSCAGRAFVADEGKGRWEAAEDTGKWLEKECGRPGLAGCSRCLKALNQLNPSNASLSNQSNSRPHVSDRECQLMGLTWLLSRDRARYLPTATSVIRAFMAVDDSGEPGPTSCSVPLDEMPFAVGSSEINGDAQSAAAAFPSAILPSAVLPTAVLAIILFIF